jgi:NADPH2:quinone reductase
MGAEFAGRVAANSPIPAGCKYRPGDRVFGSSQGAYAEQITVDHARLVRMPDNITYEQAAGIYVTIPTSYEGLVGRANTQPGEWVLVHAAAGGVGIAAVQVAKALGAKVIAACGSAEKRRIAIEYGGADVALDYNEAGWQDEVKKITGGRGVDVVYDPVGLLVPSLKCIAWNGRLVVVGFAAGTIEKIPANLVLLKNVSIVGLHWGATALKDPKRYFEVLDLVMELISSGRLIPQVYDPVYEGLDKVVPGLRDLEDRKTWGKAVVRVRKEDKAKL